MARDRADVAQVDVAEPLCRDEYHPHGKLISGEAEGATNRHDAWETFDNDDSPPDIVTAYRMSDAADGVSPALVLRLFASTPHLYDGTWPRLADPLFRVEGFDAVFRAARDRLSPALDAAIRVGLVRAGRLDPSVVSDEEVLALADAALVEAASPDAVPDALREGDALGAVRWRRALLDRLARSEPREGLSEAGARWLLDGLKSPRDRVLCKLRTSDVEGSPVPIPIEGPEESASLDELLSSASDLSDDVAFAALAALDARGLDAAPSNWEALLRASHLTRWQDFGEAPTELGSALRHASVATRARLLAGQATFPWRVAYGFRGVPGVRARAEREAALALGRGASRGRGLEPHEIYEIERGVAALVRRHSRRARPTHDDLPSPLVHAIDAGLRALDADVFALVPRSISSRVFDCLAGGAPCRFLTNERFEALLQWGAEIDVDDREALLAVELGRGEGPPAEHWRARVRRLIELHAPEPVLARDISSLRLAERFPRAPDASHVFAYPSDGTRARGLRRQLELSVRVGERVLREVAPGSKLSRIAPKLLEDLVRLRDGQGRAHAQLGEAVEDYRGANPRARKSWAACAYLYVQAEHFMGNPRCTIQDTPLDLAQQAYMPEGFWRREGHAERRRFWAWLLLEAAPSAYRFAR